MTEGDVLSYQSTGEGSNRFLRRTGIIFCILFLSFYTLSAQRKVDMGLFAGTSYYMGDINMSTPFYRPSFAAGPIFRYNFNPRNSLRGHAFYHGLSGSDLDFANNFRPGGAQEFEAKFVDLGLDFEFNWWPYQTAVRKTRHTPYVFAGIGYGLKLSSTSTNGEVKSHVTLPFGLGYKINVGKWLSAGLEAGPRKTFSDLVDGVTNPPVDGVVAPFGNRDWYIFTGVFVTYKIFKFWESCPTYEEHNPKRKKR